MILRRGQNFSPNKRKLSTAGTEITPLVELISKPNKMNFKSFPFLVHLHNLYIVKIFCPFSTFFWHCNPSDHFASLHNVLVGIACERQTFLLAHRRWRTFREEERLRLSDRNSILMTLINVYSINPVVMGFQMQICSILRLSWSILEKCCVYLRMRSSKTQMLLLEKTIFHKYWLFC